MTDSLKPYNVLDVSEVAKHCQHWLDNLQLAFRSSFHLRFSASFFIDFNSLICFRQFCIDDSNVTKKGRLLWVNCGDSHLTFKKLADDKMFRAYNLF